jgi:hypothetical protein
MKFSLASRRSSKARQKGKKAGMVRIRSAQDRFKKNLPQVKGTLKSTSILWPIVILTWAIATVIASVAWAISSYLIEREKQQAQVKLARLERKTKKKASS